MRFFSYRNKRAMRIVLLSVLGGIVLLALIMIGRISYLGRYVVYSEDGVSLNYNQNLTRSEDAAPAAEEEFPFSTLAPMDESDSELDPDTIQLSGYYISTTMLANELSEVQTQVSSLDETVNAILIDVKSPLGNFYYSTNLPDALTADADIEACDALISQLLSMQDIQVIARVPAFSDPNYVVEHYSEALQVSGGLWMDERRCYWMDPTYAGVQDYLLSIALELESLGFDGVLFDNFYIPADSSILWDDTLSTRSQSLITCADELSTNLSGSSIRLMLGTEDPELAEYCSRVFLTTDSAEDLSSIASSFSSVVTDPAVSLVVLTESRDTHFNSYSLIRPLLSHAQADSE